MLQKKDRLQVSKLVRSQYELVDSAASKVDVSVVCLWGARESFVAKMQKGGWIVIPNLTVTLLKHDKHSIERYVIEVTLEPT
jgi:hypothetical protein